VGAALGGPRVLPGSDESDSPASASIARLLLGFREPRGSTAGAGCSARSSSRACASDGRSLARRLGVTPPLSLSEPSGEEEEAAAAGAGCCCGGGWRAAGCSGGAGETLPCVAGCGCAAADSTGDGGSGGLLRGTGPGCVTLGDAVGCAEERAARCTVLTLHSRTRAQCSVLNVSVFSRCGLWAWSCRLEPMSGRRSTGLHDCS
jgi:hypothetical protein